jgi:Flp pilus assembly protein TadD
VRLKPELGIAWSNKGVSLEQIGHLDEALECHERAISLCPNEALVWTNRAATLAIMGKDDEAI